MLVVPPPPPPQLGQDCNLAGAFYSSAPLLIPGCIALCNAEVRIPIVLSKTCNHFLSSCTVSLTTWLAQQPQCAGFTWKHVDTPAGGGVAVTPNCTGKAGQGCCYFQSKAEISGRGTTPLFDCWEKGGLPPAPPPAPVPPPWAGPHSCCCESCTLPLECHGMGGAGVTAACPSMMWRDPKVAHGFFTASRSAGSFRTLCTAL